MEFDTSKIYQLIKNRTGYPQHTIDNIVYYFFPDQKHFLLGKLIPEIKCTFQLIYLYSNENDYNQTISNINVVNSHRVYNPKQFLTHEDLTTRELMKILVEAAASKLFIRFNMYEVIPNKVWQLRSIKE